MPIHRNILIQTFKEKPDEDGKLKKVQDGVKWLSSPDDKRIEIKFKDILGRSFNMKSDVGESDYTMVKNDKGVVKAIVF